MTLKEYLKNWNAPGLIEPAQQQYLLDVYNRRLISVSRESSAIFYVGILFVVGSIGALASQYYKLLGPFLIALLMTALVGGLFIYLCLKKKPCSSLLVIPPHAAFDYLVYFACALLITDVTFIETQFKLMGENWRFYLLAGFFLFTFLAYFFDNRLVLSLALAKLIAFGWAIHTWLALSDEMSRWLAILGSLFFWGMSVYTAKSGIKLHFQRLWEQFGLHLFFLAVTMGCLDSSYSLAYFVLLIAGSAFILTRSLKNHITSDILFATLYFYAGLTILIKPWKYSIWFANSYFMLSASGLITVIVFLIARKRRDS